MIATPIPAREIIRRMTTAGLVAFDDDRPYCFYCCKALPDRTPPKVTLADPRFHQDDCAYVEARRYLDREGCR